MPCVPTLARNFDASPGARAASAAMSASASLGSASTIGSAIRLAMSPWPRAAARTAIVDGLIPARRPERFGSFHVAVVDALIDRGRFAIRISRRRRVGVEQLRRRLRRSSKRAVCGASERLVAGTRRDVALE